MRVDESNALTVDSMIAILKHVQGDLSLSEGVDIQSIVITTFPLWSPSPKRRNALGTSPNL